LGGAVSITINAKTEVASNKFSLSAPGKFDKINADGLGEMQPLQNGVLYTAAVDTFGCGSTVLPDTICNASTTKVMYREFVVADSGVVTFRNLITYNINHFLFQGDANALGSSQSAFAYPQKINGLIPKSDCFTSDDCSGQRFCVIPQTYTLTTQANSSHLSLTEQPTLSFNTVTTKHFSPQTAQDLGSIIDSLPGGSGTWLSDVDYYSCKDNAEPIAGLQPCTFTGIATKAI
jgi:hypothetical protein